MKEQIKIFIDDINIEYLVGINESNKIIYRTKDLDVNEVISLTICKSIEQAIEFFDLAVSKYAVK